MENCPKIIPFTHSYLEHCFSGIPAVMRYGYTTLRRTTLRLQSHFVEKAFCRSVILSNVHFVETGFRRILSTKYFMLTWWPYCIC